MTWSQSIERRSIPLWLRPAAPTRPALVFQKLQEDLTARAQGLQAYWQAVPALMHNRDLWSSFLTRNRLPAAKPHDTDVLMAEAALRQELAAQTPNSKWANWRWH